jgi:hypothetical protein
MSCSEEELHFNDIGTVLLVTINDCVSGTSTPMDVSLATSLSLVLKSPSGISYTKTAIFNTDGSDGKIKYVTVDGDLNEVGTWRMQALVAFTSSSFSSGVKVFRVYENL